MSDVSVRNGRLDAFPPEFRRNPSSWSQRLPIVALALVATAASAWLALYQWRLVGPPWDPLFGPESTARVLDSAASRRMHRWIGAPDAALGAVAYLGDAVFGLAGSTRRWQYRPWLVVLFGIDVIPLGIVSGILVAVQGLVVGSWCFLCLVTAVISLLLVALAWDEVWASLAYLRRVWRDTHDRGALWQVFWGRRHPAGERAALGRPLADGAR